MARLRYGLTPWTLNGARATASYPRLTTNLDLPVVIIGGGLTGAATAYAFAAAGIRSVLLEAESLAGGATMKASGVALAEPSSSYVDLESAHGRRLARAAWHATRRSALDFGATLRRLKIRCGYEPLDLVLVAQGADQSKRLARELQTRKDAGLDVSALPARSLAGLGVSGSSGARTHGHARLDPVRACHGLARAAAARGSEVFERTPVTHVKTTRRGVEVVTAKAVVTAQTVILTTGDPSTGFHALDRHFAALETYVVQTPPLPAAVRSSLRTNNLILQDLEQPSHRLFWTDDHRITWSGGDQERSAERARDKVLVQRTGQLMYELSLAVNAISGIQPAFGWHAPYSRAADGLPFIGPHRNYPGHLFALGLGTNLTNAFLASRILLRRYTDATEKDDEAFGFTRLPR